MITDRTLSGRRAWGLIDRSNSLTRPLGKKRGLVSVLVGWLAYKMVPTRESKQIVRCVRTGPGFEKTGSTFFLYTKMLLAPARVAAAGLPVSYCLCLASLEVARADALIVSRPARIYTTSRSFAPLPTSPSACSLVPTYSDPILSLTVDELDCA